MELTKPQRRTNFFDYFSLTKKFKPSEENNTSIDSKTCFEDLSNELFYEIFNYLDTYDIYKGFYNLNTRLHNLLCHSTLPLKIKLSSISKSSFQQFNRQLLIPNRHRIQSLYISNPFIVDSIFSPVKIASSFHRLETLIFDQVKPKYFLNILHHLASLPNLSTLIIISKGHLTNIFEPILRLSALKYCQISFQVFYLNRLIFPGTKLASSIEHLVVKYSFDIKEFLSLLSNLPHLRSLSIEGLSGTYNPSIDVDIPKSDHLKKVQFESITLNFDQFQLLSKDLFNQLENLSLSIQNNKNYLNAHGWAQLISSSMPKLRIFDFQYRTSLGDDDYDYHHSIYNSIFDEFSSLFWIQRKWFFNYQFYKDTFTNKVFFYSIDSNKRKKWILYKPTTKSVHQQRKKQNINYVDHVEIRSEETMITCSHYFNHATQLTLSDDFSTSRDWLKDILKRLIPLEQLTSLTIDNHNFRINQFIRLLRATPNIQTLNYYCQSISEKDLMEIKETKTFQIVAQINKVSNVSIRERSSSENIKLITDLCRNVQRLTIDLSNHNIQSTVRYIFSNAHTNLPHLCLLHIKDISKSLAALLKTLVRTEDLLDNCCDKLIGHDMYFWW